MNVSSRMIPDEIEHGQDTDIAVRFPLIYIIYFKSIAHFKKAKNEQYYWIHGQEIFGIYFEHKEKRKTIEKC